MRVASLRSTFWRQSTQLLWRMTQQFITLMIWRFSRITAVWPCLMVAIDATQCIWSEWGSPDVGCKAVAHDILIPYRRKDYSLSSANQAKQNSGHFNCNRTSRNKFYERRREHPQICTNVWRRLRRLFRLCVHFGYLWLYDIVELLGCWLQGFYARSIHVA